MAEHVAVILQLWTGTKPASRHQSCQLSLDLGLMALVLKQYPEYDINSLSFVVFTIPLSAIELLSFSRTSTGMVISTQIKSDIKAEPILDKAVQSHQEELVTLEMCCSLIDCTLQPSTKVDIVLGETEQNHVDLLLDVLGNTTQAAQSTDIDLCEKSIQYLSRRGNADEHNHVSDPSHMPNFTTDTSEDIQATSTIPTQLSQDELKCCQKLSPYRTPKTQDNADPIVRWNDFAESHGATPTAKRQANDYSTMSSYPDTQPAFFRREHKPASTAPTGGYMTDSKRIYEFIDQDRSFPRDTLVAKRRNRNTAKTASHTVARLPVSDTYVQPFYSQSSTSTAKHGSLW